MATEEPKSFDDFPTTDEPDDADGDGWINLGPGDEAVGDLTDFSPLASYNGVVEVDGRPHRINATMRKSIIRALIADRRIAIRKSEDTETYVDEDGNEQEYHPREVRVL